MSACWHCDNGAFVDEVDGHLIVYDCPFCSDRTADRHLLRLVVVLCAALLVALYVAVRLR